MAPAAAARKIKDRKPMEDRRLGRTGVPGLKALPRHDDARRLGNADHEDSIRIIHRTLDAGINFVGRQPQSRRHEYGEQVLESSPSAAVVARPGDA